MQAASLVAMTSSMKAAIGAVELGFACWLEDVRAAIEAGRVDFPPHYASFYERFRGAASMAEAYLLNLDWMEDKSGKTIMDFLKPRSAQQP